VNGNTRRAALQEIGQSHIRVGVLDNDWSWGDVGAVELALQLRREYRRDYSFINNLLAIDEQVQLGRQPNDIARDFRVRLATFHKYRWLLDFIRSAIERSKVSVDGHSAALRLVDFERDQGKLEELYRAYAALEAKDPDSAAILRETRLAAVALDFSKTDVRLIQPDFFTKHVEQSLAGAVVADDSASVAIPGLAVTVPDASARVKRVEAVTTAILQGRAAATLSVAAAAPVVETFAKAKEVFDAALDDEGRTARLRKRQLAAPDRINDAADTIELAVQQLVESRASSALDEDAFDEAIGALRRAVTRLAQQAGRTVTSPGSGMQWLSRAAAITDEP
jgi:hypothetical protein